MRPFGYVYKIEKNKVIVLSPTEGFIVLKKPKYVVLGQKIDYSSKDLLKPTNIYFSIVAGIAATIIFLLSFFYTNKTSNEIYGYFDADMNNSVEFAVNQKFEVVNATALTTDSEKLISKTKLTGISINEAINKFVEHSNDKSTKNNNLILSACLNRKIENFDNIDREDLYISETLSNICKQVENSNQNVTVQSFKLTYDDRNTAIKSKLSMGRYCLYVKSVKLGNDIKTETIQNMTPTEIISQIKTIEDNTNYINVNINPAQKYQTIEGLGGSIAYYANWLTAHPNKSELYNIIFKDLGINILRIRNNYINKNVDNDKPTAEIINEGSKQLNNNLKVLMSSWTPPNYLKSNDTEAGGTLSKDNKGYTYNQFADYWFNSLNAYNAIGIRPNYISIQNQPNIEDKKYPSCNFDPKESNKAGYAEAFDAVYNKLQTLNNPPKLIAPETSGINEMMRYVSNIDLNKIFGLGFHIYGDGNESNPDSYNKSFNTLATSYTNKIKMQTEYTSNDPFQMAWTINNSLVNGNINSFMYYGLIWNNNESLITLEDPWKKETWKTKGGYLVSDRYYMFKQFSKFIKSGYKRIDSQINLNTIKCSSFISPDNTLISSVFINTSDKDETLKLNFMNYNHSNSEIYRTNKVDKTAFVGSLNSNDILELPAKSVVTVVVHQK